MKSTSLSASASLRHRWKRHCCGPTDTFRSFSQQRPNKHIGSVLLVREHFLVW